MKCLFEYDLDGTKSTTQEFIDADNLLRQYIDKGKVSYFKSYLYRSGNMLFHSDKYSKKYEGEDIGYGGITISNWCTMVTDIIGCFQTHLLDDLNCNYTLK